MGKGPVSGPTPKKAPGWTLASPHDKNTQGIVVSGFAHLPAAEALFLRCPKPSGQNRGAWLRTLQTIAPITDADGKDARGSAIAFTYTGLETLGLGPQALASFSAPFREGMFQEDRLRRLGDKGDNGWRKTVIDGGPRWSGNTPPRVFDSESSAAIERVAAPPKGVAAPPKGVVGPPIGTADTVHAILLLYERDEETVSAWAKEVATALIPHEVTVRRLPLDLHLDAEGLSREHFGFGDGISQPIPFDKDGAVLVAGKPASPDRWHGVPLGEILIGHTDGHHEKAPGPMIEAPKGSDPNGSGLKPEGVPEGFLNFGLDGSYFVVRELKQDVAAFWTSMEKGAARIQAHDPTASHATATWLAERVVGRSLDGHLLCPAGYVPADQDGKPRNDFGFIVTDPEGRGCPPGAHVRRGNPRDGLAPDAASAQTLLDAANNHRILRRARKFGPKIAPGAPDDAEDRGLLFMCLNTDIARQFEFVQQTWILNANFATLFDETDPLVGPEGTFTIREPGKPLRRIVEVDTFVKMAGGEYFFLPSIPAINYLASL